MRNQMSGEKSPLNPHECAVWANQRMKPEHQGKMEYRVIEGELALVWLPRFRVAA